MIKSLERLDKIDYQSMDDNKYLEFNNIVNLLIKELSSKNIIQKKYIINNKNIFGYNCNDFIIKISYKKLNGKYPFGKVEVIYKKNDKYLIKSYDSLLGKDSYISERAPNGFNLIRG